MHCINIKSIDVDENLDIKKIKTTPPVNTKFSHTHTCCPVLASNGTLDAHRNIFFAAKQYMIIRKAIEADFVAMWDIFHAVVASGDTYVFSPNTSREEAHTYWLGPDIASFVAETDGNILGFYKLIPNQPDLGSHVANASFMVGPKAHGQGVGKAMGRHCLIEAKKAGYHAIQFNFVVSTNDGAVALWKQLGFAIVGTLPKVFKHARLGYVDAYVMHRFLDDINVEQEPISR